MAKVADSPGVRGFSSCSAEARRTLQEKVKTNERTDIAGTIFDKK
jgi:hypothetical protein